MSSEKENKFLNIFISVFLVMIGFGFFIGFLAIAMDALLEDDTPEPALVELAEQRIKPVGQVYIAGQDEGGAAPQAAAGTEMAQATGAGAAEEVDGKKLYETACFSCHGTGLAGAPKFGSAEDWAPRLKQGMDMLYEHSLKGLNAMPPKGGFVNYSDEQVKAAVDYMAQSVQ